MDGLSNREIDAWMDGWIAPSTLPRPLFLQELRDGQPADSAPVPIPLDSGLPSPLPPPTDGPAWLSICHRVRSPPTSLFLALSEPAIVELLASLTECYAQGQGQDQDQDQEVASTALAEAARLSPWLYATLAAVSKPLAPESLCDVRAILRKSVGLLEAEARASSTVPTLSSSSSWTPDPAPEAAVVDGLVVLAVICGKYFHQDDGML